MTPRRIKWLLAVYWLAMVAATHWPRLVLEINGRDIGDLGLDKLIHLAAYAVLTVLALLAQKPQHREWTLTAVVLFTLGVCDEWSQQFVLRQVSFGDAAANIFGVLLAIAGCAGAGIAMDRGEETPTLRCAQPGACGVTSEKPKDTFGGGYVRHAKIVSMLTLLSRLTGLARDSALAAVLGLSGVSDAFFFGFLIPNLFRRLFGEGALSAAFIPVYSRLVEQDREKARRMASLCIALLTVALGGLTLLGEGALLAMRHVVDWGDTTDSALRLMMIMLPYMPLVCLVALIGGILQVHGKFGASAAAPIVLNLAMIAAAVLGGLLLPGDQQLTLGVDLIAASVVVAGLVQLAWQWWAMRHDAPFTLLFTGIAEPMRQMLTAFLPMLLGLAVFQINTALDSTIAFGLAQRPDGPDHWDIMGIVVTLPIRDGAVAALNWSQRLYQFPLGVFGIAIATAIFPALSRAAARSRDEMTGILHNGLRLTMFIGLPASLGLILVRVPLVRAIFQYGRFDLEDARRVAFILAGYSACVWAYTMTHVLTRAFYAMGDTKTPLKITMCTVVMNLLLNLMLIWPLGAAGLAWATAICAAWQSALLAIALRRYLPHPVSAEVWRSWGRTAMLTLAMGAAIVPVGWWRDPDALGRKGSAVVLVIMVAVGVAVYAGGALLLKCPEVAALVRRHRESRPD
ncbi:MAG: murein biosynthesis integral membrane protein MurJ [Phycisphaeraceae bacterium]|nr:murein biosynthesis integral membrane protein MurJ [Phycisphaeraceae bacterium]